MRYFAALAVAIAATMVCGGDMASAEARIEGYEFSCDAPDGTRLKPRLGDVEGVLYAGLPAEGDHCLRTIARKIDLCRENIDFEAGEKSQSHAACLPIFERQAEECIAHFERESVRCTMGRRGPDHAAATTRKEVVPPERPYAVTPLDRPMDIAERANVRAGPGTAYAVLATLDAGDRVHVTGSVRGRDWLRIDLREDGSPAFVYAPLLKRPKAAAGVESSGSGWSVTGNQPCRVWNFGDGENEPFTWSGVCVDGKASGQGRFTIRGGRYVYEGVMQAGKMQGYGTFVWADGERYEGEWRDGRPHGHGAYTLFDGDVYRGRWRDGCFGHRDGRWASIATSATACNFE